MEIRSSRSICMFNIANKRMSEICSHFNGVEISLVITAVFLRPPQTARLQAQQTKS
jgi:hypothetical protein